MAQTTSTPPPPETRERRANPRIPADLGVVLEGDGRRVMGVTIDASEGGLRVSLREPVLEPGTEIAIRMNLPDTGWYRLEGEIVRAEDGDGGTVVGIRVNPESGAPSRPAGPPTTRDGRGRRRRVRKSRAKERVAVPRPRPVVLAELRALGGFVYEQCILGEEDPPSEATMSWVRRLADELDLEPPGEVGSYHLLMHVLAELHRARRSEVAEVARG